MCTNSQAKFKTLVSKVQAHKNGVLLLLILDKNPGHGAKCLLCVSSTSRLLIAAS